MAACYSNTSPSLWLLLGYVQYNNQGHLQQRASLVFEGEMRCAILSSLTTRPLRQTALLAIDLSSHHHHHHPHPVIPSVIPMRRAVYREDVIPATSKEARRMRNNRWLFT